MKKCRYWCSRCAYDSRVIYKTKEDRKAIRMRHVYRQHDKKAGRDFGLNIDDFRKCLHASCIYCGRPATGFDRLDNEQGHTKENVVPCCVRCNRVRGNMLKHETMIEVGKLLKVLEP